MYSACCLEQNGDVSILDTDQQTLNTKQIGESFEENLWVRVLSTLKLQTASATFYNFVADTRLQSIQDWVATITTPKPFAIDWLENRMQNNLKKTLNLELRLLGEAIVVKMVQIGIEAG